MGGKAGQGINKISEIVSETLVRHGYYVFVYRDYQSLIRGGHNFNIVSILLLVSKSYNTFIEYKNDSIYLTLIVLLIIFLINLVKMKKVIISNKNIVPSGFQDFD